MLIVHLSDTHGNYELLSPYLKGLEADVIVHSGDFTHRARDWNEIFHFLKWFNALPFKHKIIVPGNHHLAFEELQRNAHLRSTNIPKGIHLLMNEAIVIEDLKFYGSPYTPAFNDWGFQLRGEREAKACWQKIPEDTDVLITHGPAKGVLDQTRVFGQNEHLGCPHLTKRIWQLHLKAHLFGHIHGGYGRKKVGNYTALNSAVLTENYQLKNAPQILEV